MGSSLKNKQLSLSRAWDNKTTSIKLRIYYFFIISVMIKQMKNYIEHFITNTWALNFYLKWKTNHNHLQYFLLKMLKMLVFPAIPYQIWGRSPWPLTVWPFKDLGQIVFFVWENHYNSFRSQWHWPKTHISRVKGSTTQYRQLLYKENFNRFTKS